MENETTMEEMPQIEFHLDLESSERENKLTANGLALNGSHLVSISSTFYMCLLCRYFCAKNYKAIK